MTATGPTESGVRIVSRFEAACQRNTLIGTRTKIQNFPPTMQHHFTDIGEQGHNPHDPVRHAAQRIRYGQRVHGHPGSQRKGRCHVHAQKPAVKAPGHTNQEKTNEWRRAKRPIVKSDPYSPGRSIMAEESEGGDIQYSPGRPTKVGETKRKLATSTTTATIDLPERKLQPKVATPLPPLLYYPMRCAGNTHDHRFFGRANSAVLARDRTASCSGPYLGHRIAPRKHASAYVSCSHYCVKIKFRRCFRCDIRSLVPWP